MAKICCFSGHRSIPDDIMSEVVSLTQSAIREHYKMGVRTFKAGGALGFDTIGALLVLTLKNECPDMRLELELIAEGQEKGWSEHEISLYRSIIDRADSVRYASPTYTRGAIFSRNRNLVDGSDYIICYLKESKGGTAYTVDYARKKGLIITNIANGGKDAQ